MEQVRVKRQLSTAGFAVGKAASGGGHAASIGCSAASARPAPLSPPCGRREGGNACRNTRRPVAIVQEGSVGARWVGSTYTMQLGMLGDRRVV